jgi:hypothetical protein
MSGAELSGRHLHSPSVGLFLMSCYLPHALLNTERHAMVKSRVAARRYMAETMPGEALTGTRAGPEHPADAGPDEH